MAMPHCSARAATNSTSNGLNSRRVRVSSRRIPLILRGWEWGHQYALDAFLAGGFRIIDERVAGCIANGNRRSRQAPYLQKNPPDTMLTLSYLGDSTV